MKVVLSIVCLALLALLGVPGSSAEPSRLPSSAMFTGTPLWHMNSDDLSSFLDLPMGEEWSVGDLPSIRRRAIERLAEFGHSFLSGAGERVRAPLSKEYPYFGFIPPFIGPLVPGGEAVTTSTDCFDSIKVSASSISSGTSVVTIETSAPKSLLCSDTLMLGTLVSVKIEVLSSEGKKQIHWELPSTATTADKWDLETNGVRLFRFEENIVETVGDLIDTLVMFGSELSRGVPEIVADVNRDFLKKYVGITTEKRNVTELILDESYIHSGDFFGVIRYDGLDPVLAWAMGSTTGHTTVALWEDDQLYIHESTANGSYWPTNGIQRTPYRTWLKQAKEAGFQVVHAPLSKQYREVFNTTAALSWFRELEGLDYGYHNLLFGWLDTVNGNYPCLPPDFKRCLEWQHIEIIIGALTRLAPSLGEKIFTQALNLRVNTTGLSPTEVFQYANSLGISPNVVPTIVERDEWNYNTTRYGKPVVGKSMVCCVFVCNMWKAGGIFDSIGKEINCAELTNFDDYALDLFDMTTPRPEVCVKADPNNFLCQLEGEYTLELNKYSSKTPYPHYAEHCPGQAPDYNRPGNC